MRSINRNSQNLGNIVSIYISMRYFRFSKRCFWRLRASGIVRLFAGNELWVFQRKETTLSSMSSGIKREDEHIMFPLNVNSYLPADTD